MDKQEWKDTAICKDYDTNIFFDKYEEDLSLRPAIDQLCAGCHVKKLCFATGVSQKAWGVWGGVYLADGMPSREFNNHRNKQDWAKTWQTLTMED